MLSSSPERPADKLGPLLVQLPPSLEYDASLAGAFLVVLRALHDGPVALEPRHESWFTPGAAAHLAEYAVARVAADPARVPDAARGARELWCIFDNTASGAALTNALELLERLPAASRDTPPA